MPQPKLEGSKHQLYGRICPQCGIKQKVTLPASVASTTVQYGHNVKALVSLLNIHYRIPYKKLQLLFIDMFGFTLNERSIINFNKNGSDSLATTIGSIQKKL